MTEPDHSKHRDRLKRRFLNGDPAAQTDEAVLELLLFQHMPRRDVKPWVDKLLTEHGSLLAILAARGVWPDRLRSTTDLIVKLAGRLSDPGLIAEPISGAECQAHMAPPCVPAVVEIATDEDAPFESLSESAHEPGSLALFPEASAEQPPTGPREFLAARTGTELFGKSLLGETIRLLPDFPDAPDLGGIKAFLRGNLAFSSEVSRDRYTSYVVRRLYTRGYPDAAIHAFARRYRDRPELKDVCYYRFCAAEPLLFRVTDELLIPNIGSGLLPRSRVRNYLQERFPTSGSIKDCMNAMMEAFAASGVVSVGREELQFVYRAPRMASFAFVLHSEYPEPGMYDIAALEQNRAVRALLWEPGTIVPALYELRNKGILSKVSEIDRFCQFTTRFTLDELVPILPA